MTKESKNLRGAYKIFAVSISESDFMDNLRKFAYATRKFSSATSANLAFLLLLFTFALLLLSLKTVNAQGVDVGIYPPIIQINAKPPATPLANFFVQNNSNSPLDLDIVLKPFTASDMENGEVSYDATQTFDDPNLLQKVQIFDAGTAVNSVYLGPNEKKNLSLQIEIPSNEPLSDYYFSVLFVSRTQDFSNVNLSQVSAAIATNVLLSIGPKGPTQGFIQQFATPFFVNSGPIPFTVEVKNTSSHFIIAKGEILIKNLFGQTIGKVTLLPSNILANSSRRITDDLQMPSKAKDFAKIQNVVLANKYPVAVWPEKYLFGPYTATLTISLSDNGPTFVRQIHFFAFPLEALISLIIIIFIISFIILRVKRKLPEFQG